MRRCFALACLVITFVFIEQCSAQYAVEFGRRVLGGGFSGSTYMQGWEFIPSENLFITQLGLFDGRSSGGLAESHSIGLWNSSGGLVVSAAIGLGETTPLVGNFRYVNIPPTPILSGQTYIVAALMPSPAMDYTFFELPDGAAYYGYHIDPRIQLTASRAGPAGGLTFPTNRFTGFIGGFGPNFFIQVPEPSSLLMVAISLLLRFPRRNPTPEADSPHYSAR